MLEWHAVVGITAGIVQIVGVVPYIRDMLRGTTRPNIVSWGLWTLIEVIAVAAQISAGASWSVILLIAMIFCTGSITLLGAVGYGYKEYGRLDWACLAIALVAIVLWQITNQPVVALVFSVLADFTAAAPTIAKTYKDPKSENLSAWIFATVAAGLSIISTTKIDVANLIFPIYLVFINGSVAFLAFFGHRSRQKG